MTWLATTDAQPRRTVFWIEYGVRVVIGGYWSREKRRTAINDPRDRDLIERRRDRGLLNLQGVLPDAIRVEGRSSNNIDFLHSRRTRVSPDYARKIKASSLLLTWLQIRHILLCGIYQGRFCDLNSEDDNTDSTPEV